MWVDGSTEAVPPEKQMTTLGVGLIVIGVALVSGGLILWPRASQREDEDQADATMADVLQRLNESSDADPLK